MPDNLRLNLSNCMGFTNHRSGWNYAIKSLSAYHSKSGIYVDDFIERSFSWDIEEYEFLKNKHKLPYNFKWVGFLHNPPNMPYWFDTCHSPQAILNRPVFQKSLKNCVCIFTLSNYLRDWLKTQIDVPVFSVMHPTEHCLIKWSPFKFIKKEKTLVQLGYWLRNIGAICDIKNTIYSKKWLPSDVTYARVMLDVEERINSIHWTTSKYRWEGTEILGHLKNEDYDELLSYCVVFLNLYDSSANNAIIECIARNTPVLVNKIPAVVEYLGEDYPLYIDQNKNMLTTQNVLRAHHYLKNMNKDWLNGTYFCSKVVESIKEVL